jgi:hypothetical protein
MSPVGELLAPKKVLSDWQQRIESASSGEKSHLLDSLADAVKNAGTPANQFRRKKDRENTSRIPFVNPSAFTVSYLQVTSGLLKLTGQICLILAFLRSALKSNSLAG